MANNKKKLKCERTTQEQLSCYLEFCQKHPEILIERNANSVVTDTLWQLLGKELNSLSGPKRAPDKWKLSLGLWRSQLEMRARKKHSLHSKDILSEFDERALSILTSGKSTTKELSGTFELYLCPNEIPPSLAPKGRLIEKHSLPLPASIKNESVNAVVPMNVDENAASIKKEYTTLPVKLAKGNCGAVVSQAEDDKEKETKHCGDEQVYSSLACINDYENTLPIFTVVNTKAPTTKANAKATTSTTVTAITTTTTETTNTNASNKSYKYPSMKKENPTFEEIIKFALRSIEHKNAKESQLNHQQLNLIQSIQSLANSLKDLTNAVETLTKKLP